MPLRPEHAARYPKDWPAISQRIRQRANNACEFCGVKNYRLGGRLDGVWFDADILGCNRKLPDPGSWAWCSRDGRTERLRIVRIVLTVAHLDHQPEHCDDDNLKALCQRCHLNYDAKFHAINARETRRKAMNTRDLFEEHT